ncbi:MAG: HD domain-containing protein [Candidatus Thermoplasmatota archaeon]|nr:HD domain-containing protein [Candidatus Thermoplasmatota archaeon]
MAIEHTAVMQLRDRTFGPPITNRIYVPLPISSPGGSPMREKTEMASKQLISGLKPGEKVESYFSVNYKKPVTDYKYGAMFEFRVADRSGQVTVKYWGGQDKVAVERIQDSFDREDIVGVVGEVAEFRGQLEISVSEKNGGRIRRLVEGEYDLKDLIKSFENIGDMQLRLGGLVESVRNMDLKRLLDAFFSDAEFLRRFSEAPASIQLHSAAVGGLLHHTLNVADLAMTACELHPELDRDLVLAGALLHDIGKVQSFKVTSNICQTEEGNLLGHITLGDQELVRRMSGLEGFPALLASKMRHVLLAHHGRKEWGSPVDPMFPEALLVHEADDLDAKLDNMITKREEAVTEDDWIWDQRHGRLIYLK